MKKFRKLLAVLAAGALTVSSAIPVFAAQSTDGLADGTAYLNINNEDWSDFDAEWTNAEITGDGQYTVGMVASEGVSLVQFNALEVVNGESYLGTGCVLTVDSITVNGEEAELQGASYTCSADGAGVTTRVNIYNEWNTPDETATAGDDGHLDCRVAEGSVADATACLISSDYCNASSGSGFLVESMEVTFTVSGFGTSAAAGEASEEGTAEAQELPAEGTTAYLTWADSTWAIQYWFDGNDYSPVVANNATVTGYGQYTVSLDFTGVDGGVSPDVTFFDVEVAGGESYFPNCYMTIDSVKVNGEDVEVGTTYTSSDDGVATRTNLYNTWVSEVTEGRTADGSSDGVTATPVAGDTLTNIETIEVTFTLGDGVAFGGEDAGETAASVEAVDLDGTYNAYLGLQTPTYSFRNSFDDETYGRDTEYFNQITGWDGADAITREGTFTDAVIAGNGTYTVSVSGMDLSGDFDSQDYFNLIFLSTDIPNTGEITISDMVLTVDGRDVSISPILSPDSVNYVNMLIQNIWNEDVATIGYYSVPPTEMSITFTVSGFNYDNPDAVAEESAAEETTAESTEAAAEETTETEESSGSNTGVIVVVVIVIIVVVVAVVLAMKKKK